MAGGRPAGAAAGWLAALSQQCMAGLAGACWLGGRAHRLRAWSSREASSQARAEQLLGAATA